MLPFILFNNIAGIVGLVWLFYLGEWKFALLTILTLFFTKMLLALLMIPVLPLMWLIAWLLEIKQKFWVCIVGFINLAFTMTLMTVWTILIFFGVIFYASGSSFFDGSFLPYLLVGYGVALRPIQALAQEDTKSGMFESTKTAFLLALAYIISIIYFIYYDADASYTINIFSIIICLNILFDCINVYKNLDEEMG